LFPRATQKCRRRRQLASNSGFERAAIVPQDSFPPETRSELNFRDFNTTVFRFGVNSVAAGPPIFEAFAHKQEKVELWEALPPYREDIEQKLEQQLNLHPYHFSGKAESSKVVHDCFCAAP